MRYPTMITIGVATFWLGACDPVDSVLGPPKQARFLDGCEVTGPMIESGDPPPSQCTESYAPVEQRHDFATDVGPASGTEGIWSGESFDSFNMDEADWVCFDHVDNPTFSLYIIEYGETAKFTVPGRVQKISDDGYSAYGLPMATYQLPANMAIVSQDGKYVVQGGTIKARCVNFTLRLGGINRRIEGGWDVWFEENVNVYRNPGQSSDDGRGWTWRISDSGFENGAGQGWVDALNYYLATGNCKLGWEVYIDNKEVCNADGVLQSCRIDPFLQFYSL